MNNNINGYYTIMSTKDQKRDAKIRLKESKKRQHFGTKITCKKEEEKNIDHIKHKNFNILPMRLKIGETTILLLSIYTIAVFLEMNRCKENKCTFFEL